MTDERGRGWGAALALTVFAVLVSAVHPALLIAVPLSLLLIALPPLKSPFRVIGLVLLGLMLAARQTGPLWYAERGWALMLGSAFLAVVVLWPRGRFIGRGLVATGLAAATGGLVVWASGSWRRIEANLAGQFDAAASFWSRRVANAPEADVRDMASMFGRIAHYEVVLYPAMLGLASLAALAVAWYLYRRLVDVSIPALSPLREFRFTDHLIWLLIIGGVLLVLPDGASATRAGVNLATFMAALYVLRGAAVIVALTTPGVLASLLMAIAAVLMLPFVAGAALVVGLTDTWLDLRRRIRPEDESEHGGER